MKHANPGTGATEYARNLTVGLTREKAAVVIQTHTPEDRRVKHCDYCGCLWRDGSLRNTSRTCCDECKTSLKTEQRARQRAEKALLSGKVKKKTKRDLNYVWWLEYPFWLDEYEMLKLSWKYEVPTDFEKLDIISAQQQIHGPGNRKKGNGSPNDD